MPLPAPNLYPPFHIVRLSHVELHVTDLARSRAFWVDTLGLQVTHEDDELITLRAMEERNHHCVILAGRIVLPQAISPSRSIRRTISTRRMRG